MAAETIYFGKNKSASWTVPAITITAKINCPNGMVGRLSTAAPSTASQEIDIPETGDRIIFTREDMNMIPGIISVTTDDITPYLIFLNFDTKNTYIVVHDGCYQDFFRKSGDSVKTVEMFSKDDKAGDYVYDRDSASFIAYDASIDELKDRQTYSSKSVDTPFQNKANKFPAFVETGDIVFADFAVTDKAIDIYVNATISLAGLKLTWASSTNAVFQNESIRFKLGEIDLTGSFENSPVRYTGKRFLKSIKLQPQSRVSEAIRYKIYADFVNNGYDDIEIHDINILTEMLFAEVSGGQDA